MKRYPVLAFVALAYGVSWLAWTPYVLSLDGLGVLPFRVPALVGGSQFTGIAAGAYLGPLCSAFVVTAVTEGRDGLRRWRRRLLHWRTGWHWYAFALIGFPAVVMAGILVAPGGAAAFRVPSPALLLTYVPMLVMQVATTGISEEPGWRDFALVRLQQRMHPLLASTVLGVIWAGWHFPLLLTAWARESFHVGLLGQAVVSLIALSFVISWLFNRSGESLPVIMLLHATFNNATTVAWPEIFPGLDRPWWVGHLGVFALAAVVVVATRGRLGARTTPCPSASPARPAW